MVIGHQGLERRCDLGREDVVAAEQQVDRMPAQQRDPHHPHGHQSEQRPGFRGQAEPRRRTGQRVVVEDMVEDELGAVGRREIDERRDRDRAQGDGHLEPLAAEQADE